MSLSFISTDPADKSYDAETATIDNAAKVGQQIGVDQAVRSGVQDMLANSPAQQPAYHDPMSSPQAAAPPPQLQAPAPGARGPQLVSADGSASPTTAPAAALESGGNPGAINSQGYFGKYGFGKAALIDAGVYQAQPGEPIWNNRDYLGTFNVPGFGPMTYDQFRQNGPAQDAAYQQHVAAMDRQIVSLGLDKYIGQTVGGVPITRETLEGMVHGGGAAGAQKFLASNGQYNPADTNGTTIADFGTKIGGGGAQMAGGYTGGDMSAVLGFANPVNGGGSGGTSLMPGFGTSRFDPILARLAQTPGGGTAALPLLEAQGRFDQATYRRTDTYQRLAMQALAHGDTQTARFYAEAGGLQLPEGIMQNQNNASLLGRAGVLAHQIYGADPMQAQAFVQRYLQTGDVTQAFTAAGAPRSNPHYTLQMAQGADGTLKAYAFNPQNGTVSPVTNTENGSQFTTLPKTPAAVLTAQARHDALVRSGVPDAEATQIVNNPGAAIRPGSVSASYNSIYRAISAADLTGSMPENEKQERVGQQMDAMYGPAWRQTIHIGAPAYTTPTPGGGAPMATQGTAGGMPSPGQAGPMAAPNGADIAASQQSAIAAVQRNPGARAQVIKRLQDAGIPIPPGL